MGLFSSKKKTYVSSVVYNLAGPIEDRPDYLKSVLLGKVLSNNRERLSDSINKAYLGGAGLRFRSYHRWCRTNFKQVGVPTDRFYGKPQFNQAEVAAALLADYEITASIDWVDSGGAEIEMWGRQWMRANMPEKEATDTWTVDYVEDLGEGLINFTDGTPAVRFDPVGYRQGGDWLYVSYSRPTSVNRWTTPLLFIYERGTGSAALDQLFDRSVTTGEYLPFIPIRHETKFLSESYKPEVFKEAKKAYKKATGAKISELIENIADNPDLDQIDFTYIVFGVSFNIKDMASKRYMFTYLKHLMNNQVIGATTFNEWMVRQPGINAGIVSWLEWAAVQNGNAAGSPIVGAQPNRPATTAPPMNSVIIQDRGPGQTNMKMEITWFSIVPALGQGLGKADAKVGDVWFTFAGGQVINARSYTADEAENLQIDTVEAYWQKSATEYEKLTIKGLTHINHIYNGKTEVTTAAQALVDEDESGFIIPIHYETFKEMSLVDSTQMATQSMNLVFNCYQIVKKKWYQRGLFKVLLVVVIIVVSIYYPPAGALFGGGGGGLLGASATVGAALGFAGTAALIAGTIANMVAAMILTKLITYVSVELLGEKIGFIVAAIASFVALNVGTSLANGGSLAGSWSAMMEPMNLMALTNSVGNAYSQIINADTMDLVKKSQEALNDYRDQSLELQENYAQQFGYGSAYFDPMSLTETGQSFFTETSETFLGRTLMTGSDIAQMGNDLITNFVELTLQNEFKE